ncbi:MAG: hypothetical protein FJX74_19950 [Armatimonadetes bacterium]|nr:hypothetical protein [Armatimonadota bacterium]
MDSRDPLNAGGHFGFVLTADEHALLLGEAVARGGPMELLWRARPVSDGFALDLSLADLASLAQLAAAVADGGANAMARLVATELCERLADFMVAAGLGQDHPSPDDGPAIVRNDEQAVVGVGVSRQDLRRLVTDWEGERPAIRLNRALSLDEVGKTRYFEAARAILQALEAEGGETRATPKGNLNRQFAETAVLRCPRLVEHMEAYRGRDRRPGLNEEDVGDIHYMRIVLTLSRLIARRRNTIRITKKGRQLLEDGRAGELYALLFRTFFRELNLAYIDWLAVESDFQHLVGVGLFYVHAFGDTWRREDRLSELVVPEPLLPLLGDLPPAVRPGRVVRARLLRPLEDFGLVEVRDAGQEGHFTIREVRKTPLFDRFITFDLGPEKPAGPTHDQAPGVH